jgi:RNA polymerase sigma-70 factor (ECF subfamily)
VLPQPTTHRTLLARLADLDDQTAWRDFHHRYAELIRGFSRRRGVRPADCDDVVQEVLLALQKAMPHFVYDPARGTFRAYLKSIVGSAVQRRFCQKDGPRPLQLDEGQEPPALDDETERMWELEWQQYHVRLAMRTIEVEFGPADRAAFQGYAVEGRDAGATAAALGLSVEQVYQAKSRIMRRLSQLIEQQVAEEG